MVNIIGLTGGIASGKSTVSNYLKSKKFPVIDSDVIAREVVEIGKPAYRDIVDIFGASILLPDHSLNRKKLGNIVFSHEEMRHQLNHVVHPRIREETERQIREFTEAGHETIFLDIPLLFETNAVDRVEKVIVVYVDERTQLIRLMNRNALTEQEAIQRIQSQMPLKDKAEKADGVVFNTSAIEETYAQMDEFIKKWNLKP